MTEPTHSLDRTILIRARPETVFAFFTDSARWASWWGAGSTIDARPGGPIHIRYPGGVEVSGEVRAIVPPRCIEFTYGFASGQPIPPGASLVTITLAPEGGGTRLSLVHTFADPAVRDQHVQGWRYQLAVFGNVVTDRLHADPAARADAWYAIWNDPDPASRTRALEALASPDLRFRDRHGLTDGIADLVPHIGAARQFMPDLTLARDGDARHCQGMLISAWRAVGPDGAVRARGTTVFTLDAEDRVDTVTGFWE